MSSKTDPKTIKHDSKIEVEAWCEKEEAWGSWPRQRPAEPGCPKGGRGGLLTINYYQLLIKHQLLSL